MKIATFFMTTVAAAATCVCMPAQANLVTFSDVAGQSAAPFDSGGLHFAGTSTYVWSGDGTHSDNGTESLIAGFGGSFTITKTGGGLFSIDALDAGLSWYTTLTSMVLNVGGESITLNGHYQTFNLSSLQNISSVTFGAAPTDGYLAVDNIVWHDGTQLPEPASMALAGAALMAAGAARRRRR